MTLIDFIQHDLNSNITIEEIVDSGDVCEWVSDYVEGVMGDLGLDVDENDDEFQAGCELIYSFFGAQDLCSGTPEWDAHWESLVN